MKPWLRLCACIASTAAALLTTAAAPRPNILLCIADDWSWPHAGAYGDPVVRTPTFDRLAREGVLFRQAFVSAPSCTSSRAALLTGQWHWRLKESANLWSTLRPEFPVYPELLQSAGYFIGHTGKGWGPGRINVGGRTSPPSGPAYPNFAAFLEARPADQPFCYWFGSSDPHRPYEAGLGQRSGVEPGQIRVPACLPDAAEVRNDIADYYWEVQRFDRQVGGLLEQLQTRGLLDNTLVVMTSDNGMPFPRCKANLYDMGTRVPLAISWPAQVKGGRTVTNLVSLVDLAPTFLEATGLKPPAEMTGQSLLPLLTGGGPDPANPPRAYIVTGKERHCPAQEAPDPGGYPSRALRTADYLYIRNYRPDRWPSGTPNYRQAYFKNAWYADTDNGPTKSFLVENRDTTPALRRLYELSFAKRPAEELYDLAADPDQLTNLAADPGRASDLRALGEKLSAELKATGDPRELGRGEELERYPYYGGAPAFPGAREP